MGEKIDIGIISKFNGTNYPQWKFQVKCALKAKGIFDIVDGTSPKPSNGSQDIGAWNKKDAQAMFTITAAMDLSQITLVENCECSQEILAKLDSIYQQKTETNRMLVHERFAQYKMDPKDNVAQHVAKVENLAKQIKEAGEIISDAAVMTKILNTLPQKFRNVRQAWLSLDESKQTIANLAARLIDEEASLTAFEETEVALASVKLSPLNSKGSSSHKSRNVVCYTCRKRGHISRYCPQLKKSSSKNTGEGTSKQNNDRGKDSAFTATNSETAFNTVEKNQFQFDTSSWVIDSGASAHMCYQRECFSSFHEEDRNSTVILGNDIPLKVKGRGTIAIQKLINGQWLNSTINDVLYVPDLKRNLFSEGVLTKKGMKIIKEDIHAKVYQNGELCAMGVQGSNNLYRMLFRSVVYQANVTSSENLKLWHERLGHVNISSLCQMVSKGLVKGVNLNGKQNFFCEACCYGKQHTLKEISSSPR